MTSRQTDTVVDLLGVLVAVTDEVPRVLVVDGGDEINLPNGPFVPAEHSSLEQGFRKLIEAQAGLDLYYIEQLYTFGNRYRTASEIGGGPRTLSVAYVALTREEEAPLEGTRWADWYDFLPWEDWRDGRPGGTGLADRPVPCRLVFGYARAGGQAQPLRARQRNVRQPGRHADGRRTRTGAAGTAVCRGRPCRVGARPLRQVWRAGQADDDQYRHPDGL